VFSAWLLFSFIPSKKPLSEVEALAYVTQGAAQGDLSRAGEWRLKPNVYPWAYVIAVLIGVWGITKVVNGATHRERPKAPRGRRH
jgi:hypothetical protein